MKILLYLYFLKINEKMENAKKILTKRKIVSNVNSHLNNEQKNDRQNEKNQNLSESGATTTSSISSNTKNKDSNGNYKTPKKNIFQNLSSPSYMKKIQKIYSKGIIKNKNSKNSNINNNKVNNNNDSKNYNRSISLISIDNNKINCNKRNIYIIKKNKIVGNATQIPSPLNMTNLDNSSNNLINSNINSDTEKNSTRTEIRKYTPSIHISNNINLTINKNLGKSFFNKENNINNKISPKNILDSYENNMIGNGYYSEAEKKGRKSEILNLEELLMTEEKLSAVINCLKDKKPCAEECFEWMNSFAQSELIYNIDKYFVKEQFIKMIKISINANIFSLILCYVISIDEKIFENFWNNLFEIMKINHRILILMCKYFSNKIIDRNLWVEKLKQLISGYDSGIKNTFQIMKEISIFCNFLQNLIINILNVYPKLELISIYNSLQNISSIELISIYRENIHKNMNQNGSIFASSSYFRTNKINTTNVKYPFLEKKSNKKYTLVLDLDETLIHFKPNPNNDSSGKIMIRPFLYDFLRSVKKYYELIIFTAATEDYANPIINAIEKDEKFFEHRLYRMHTTIIDNDFVKDLSKLGRDLNRTIIVDNMKQNYKNQPDNGITIRPFWGKDVEDTALVDLLDILKKIAENNMNVISGLKYFKEDIISKVSSIILRRAQNK